MPDADLSEQTSVGAHSCPAAIAANIAWRNAPSALTACKRACIAATAAWSFGSSSRGRKSRYPAVMVTPWPSAFGKRRLRPAPHGIASLAADGDCHEDICLGGRTRQYPLNPCTARQPGNAQTFFWRNFYMLAWDSAPGLSTARRYRDRRSMAMSLGSSVLQWKLARVARVGSEKSSLRPLIDVKIFLSKTYPSSECTMSVAQSQPKAAETRAYTASGRRKLPRRRLNIGGFS